MNPHHSEQVLRIDTKLSTREKDQFKKLLSENLDVLAWSPTDMPGVDPSVICHKESIFPEAKPMKHKLRKLNTKHLQALNDEVDRLLNVGFIRETLYSDWLANPILVKKKNASECLICMHWALILTTSRRITYIGPSP